MGNSTDLLEAINTQIVDCGRCDLFWGAAQPVVGVGPADADIMLIGEAPGADEDEHGQPFVGKSGKVLDKLLDGIGLSREEVYITNICKCRPPDNRDPKKNEVSACREFLDGEIACVKPKVICTLGRWALQTLTEDNDASITRMNGKAVDFHGMTLVPLLHPAAGLHNPAMQGPTKDGFIALKRILGGMK